MANCDEARQYVQKFVDADKLSVGADQLDRAVQACCDDVGSRQCADAMASLAATAACDYYTGGACPACCDAAGETIGPLVGGAVSAGVGVLKGALGAIGKFFGLGGGGGGCDFDGAADKLVELASDAFRKVAAGIGTAWYQSRSKMGLPQKGPVWCTDGPGGLWVPLCLPEDIARCEGQTISVTPVIIDGIPTPIPVTWDEVLLHNAAVLSYASEANGKRSWTVKGHSGYLVMPAVEPDAVPIVVNSPEQFFAFTWEHWDCGQPNVWKSSAVDVINYRFSFVQRAALRLVEDMAVSIGREKSAQLEKSGGQAPQAPQKTNGGSVTVPLVLGLVAAGALGVYYAAKKR